MHYILCPNGKKPNNRSIMCPDEFRKKYLHDLIGKISDTSRSLLNEEVFDETEAIFEGISGPALARSVGASTTDSIVLSSLNTENQALHNKVRTLSRENSSLKDELAKLREHYEERQQQDDTVFTGVAGEAAREIAELKGQLEAALADKLQMNTQRNDTVRRNTQLAEACHAALASLHVVQKYGAAVADRMCYSLSELCSNIVAGKSASSRLRPSNPLVAIDDLAVTLRGLPADEGIAQLVTQYMKSFSGLNAQLGAVKTVTTASKAAYTMIKERLTRERDDLHVKATQLQAELETSKQKSAKLDADVSETRIKLKDAELRIATLSRGNKDLGDKVVLLTKAADELLQDQTASTNELLRLRDENHTLRAQASCIEEALTTEKRMVAQLTAERNAALERVSSLESALIAVTEDHADEEPTRSLHEFTRTTAASQKVPESQPKGDPSNVFLSAVSDPGHKEHTTPRRHVSSTAGESAMASIATQKLDVFSRAAQGRASEEDLIALLIEQSL